MIDVDSSARSPCRNTQRSSRTSRSVLSVTRLHTFLLKTVAHHLTSGIVALVVVFFFFFFFFSFALFLSFFFFRTFNEKGNGTNHTSTSTSCTGSVAYLPSLTVGTLPFPCAREGEWYKHRYRYRPDQTKHTGRGSGGGVRTGSKDWVQRLGPRLEPL